MPLKILFIGDVVGSPGRKIVGQVLPRLIPRWEHRPGRLQRRERRGRLGADDPLPRGAGRGRRRRLHDGRPRLSQGRGLHALRADRPAAPAGQLPDRLARRGARRWSRPGTGRPSPSSPCSAGPTCARSTARSARPIASWSGSAPTPRSIVVDVHAEATSDKQLLGRYLDGRVSAVLGTHTHVATADEQILPRGTAYQTDVGMTGPHDSILGRRVRPRPRRDADLRPPLLRRRHRRPSPQRCPGRGRSRDRPRPGRSAASRSTRRRPSGSSPSRHEPLARDPHSSWGQMRGPSFSVLLDRFVGRIARLPRSFTRRTTPLAL